jgi:hypothetical protein
LFVDICGAISSLQKSCQLRLEQNEVRFISILNNGHTQLWSTLKISSFFSAYDVESSESNTIVIEVNIEQVHQILTKHGSSRIDDVHLKLSRKGKQCLLAFGFQVASNNNGSNESIVSHKIPIRLIRLRDALSVSEPELPNPITYLMLPDPLLFLIRMSDRYRRLGSRKMTIKANDRGMLQFESESDEATIETTWTKIKRVELSGAPKSEPTGVTHSVTLEAKDWYNVLQINSVSRKLILGVSDRHGLALFGYLSDHFDDEEDDNVLTYYMSHIAE